MPGLQIFKSIKYIYIYINFLNFGAVSFSLKQIKFENYDFYYSY
jgi:hypothetical protein